MAQRASSCAVIPLVTERYLESVLLAAGYRRIERSRLGAQAEQVSLWEGRHLYVILIGQRVVVGPADSSDWRLRTTLAELDPSILQLIREDVSSAPPEEEARESGTWVIARRGNQ